MVHCVYPPVTSVSHGNKEREKKKVHQQNLRPSNLYLRQLNDLQYLGNSER